MALSGAIKSIINNLVTSNYTEIPERIQTGLDKYLNDDEKIVFTLLDYRAIYKAPKWVDSNTFFNSWFVLTNHRIIVARNSSSFKRFRDIPLNDITQIFYELDGSEGKISITSPGKEDIIEFSKATHSYYENLEKELKDAILQAKEHKRVNQDMDSLICAKCGSKIGSDSKYCPECGARISSF